MPACTATFVSDPQGLTPRVDLAASMCTAALATGRGDEDLAAICEVYALMAGLDR